MNETTRLRDARDEAVYRALLMLMGDTPRPLAPSELVRLLEQDGYTVAPLAAATEARAGLGGVLSKWERMAAEEGWDPKPAGLLAEFVAGLRAALAATTPAPEALERCAGWSAEWRDDATGAGMTRDEAIAALTDMTRRFTALRKAGLAIFPDADMLVEGDRITMDRARAEAFSVALAATTPAPEALERCAAWVPGVRACGKTEAEHSKRGHRFRSPRPTP